MALIDNTKLRELLAASKATLPWADGGADHYAYVNDGEGNEVADCGDGRGLDNAALICVAVNALPELLAVYEAACAWGCAGCNPCGEPGCECTECRLWSAVDRSRT